MRTDRLMKLADRLDTVPREKFDMDTWGSGGAGRTWRSTACGTTACACGWATTIPEFKKAGLKLTGTAGVFWLHFGERDGMGAAMAFFGLEGRDVDKLFYNELKTPKSEANLIRRFCKEKDPVGYAAYLTAQAPQPDEQVVEPQKEELLSDRDKEKLQECRDMITSMTKIHRPTAAPVLVGCPA